MLGKRLGRKKSVRKSDEQAESGKKKVAKRGHGACFQPPEIKGRICQRGWSQAAVRTARCVT